MWGQTLQTMSVDRKASTILIILNKTFNCKPYCIKFIYKTTKCKKHAVILVTQRWLSFTEVSFMHWKRTLHTVSINFSQNSIYIFYNYIVQWVISHRICPIGFMRLLIPENWNAVQLLGMACWLHFLVYCKWKRVKKKCMCVCKENWNAIGTSPYFINNPVCICNSSVDHHLYPLWVIFIRVTVETLITDNR